MKMPKSIYSLLSHRFPAVTWTMIIFILLALPGKMLPNESKLAIPQLDKMVHFVLFGSFVFLWSFYYAAKGTSRNLEKLFLRIVFIACLYGTAMEFLQKYVIPDRDFDVLDITADVLGALGGYFFVRLLLKVKGSGEEKSQFPLKK